MLAKTIRNGLNWSLLLLFTFPLLPIRIATLTVFPFALFSILSWFQNQRGIYSKQSVMLLFGFVLLPLLYLSELIYADNLPYVWREIQRKMGLLIFPVLFFLIRSTGNDLNPTKYLTTFVGSSLIMVVYTSIMLLISGVDQVYLESGGFVFALRSTIEELTGLHPTYFGLIISFSSCILIDRLFKTQLKSNQLEVTFLSFLILVFISFLMLLSARMVILSLIIAVCYMAILRFRSWNMRILVLAMVFGFSIMSFIFIPTVNIRLMEVFQNGLNSTNIREMIYSCSWDLARNNMIFGVGIEKLQFSLDICYTQFSMFTGSEYFQYNTHNEYLNVLCGKGIFGLLSFIFLLFNLAKQSKGKLLLQAFIILFFTTCLTENLLERQVGVFLLGVVGGVLGFSQSKDLQAKIDNQLGGPKSS